MATKVRKQVYIEPYQEAILKQLAQQEGVSEAEIIRQAIDRHTRAFRHAQPDLRVWEEELAFIDSLIQQGPAPGGRTWRRENAYER